MILRNQISVLSVVSLLFCSIILFSCNRDKKEFYSIVNNPSISAYSDFIKKNPGSVYNDSAMIKRDSLCVMLNMLLDTGIVWLEQAGSVVIEKVRNSKTDEDKIDYFKVEMECVKRITAYFEKCCLICFDKVIGKTEGSKITIKNFTGKEDFWAVREKALYGLKDIIMNFNVGGSEGESVESCINNIDKANRCCIQALNDYKNLLEKSFK